MVDLYPLTIRGPLGAASRQGVTTFARLFEHEGSVYIATTRDKGRTVTGVYRFDKPAGSPSRPGRQAKWGQWSYSSCGCTNQWGRHSRSALAAQAVEG